MVDELFAKGLTLVGIFDGFFVTDAGEADALDDDANTLVIEVCHNDWGDERVSWRVHFVGVSWTYP